MNPESYTRIHQKWTKKRLLSKEEVNRAQINPVAWNMHAVEQWDPEYDLHRFLPNMTTFYAIGHTLTSCPLKWPRRLWSHPFYHFMHIRPFWGPQTQLRARLHQEFHKQVCARQLATYERRKCCLALPLPLELLRLILTFVGAYSKYHTI